MKRADVAGKCNLKLLKERNQFFEHNLSALLEFEALPCLLVRTYVYFPGIEIQTGFFFLGSFLLPHLDYTNAFINLEVMVQVRRYIPYIGTERMY